MQEAVNGAMASTEPAAIISRRPCLLIKKIKHDIGKCTVDTDKCIGCKMCLRVGCPAVSVGRQEQHRPDALRGLHGLRSGVPQGRHFEKGEVSHV
jgi:indolepyruvate ferredoxin oxidoreductase alpha subunit